MLPTTIKFYRFTDSVHQEHPDIRNYDICTYVVKDVLIHLLLAKGKIHICGLAEVSDAASVPLYLRIFFYFLKINIIYIHKKIKIA